MFQSNALWGLLLFTLTTSIVKAEIIIDDEIEAVIIQGKINVFSKNSSIILCRYFFAFYLLFVFL